jgi:hypothetical protein
MAIPASDNFTRANETPLAGNWTAVTGDGLIDLVSNQLRVSVGGLHSCAYWNADVFNADHYSQMTLVTDSLTTIGVAVRCQSADRTYYYWARSGTQDTFKLWRCVNNVRDQIGSSYTITQAANDVLQLQIAGGMLTPYHNGVAQAVQFDSSITGGSAGVYFYAAATYGDNWSGDNSTPSSTSLDTDYWNVVFSDPLVKGANCGFVTIAPTADPLSSALGISSRVIGFKDIAPTGATSITEIGWWCDNTPPDANFEVGIYTHDAVNNRPDVLLSGASRTNAKGVTAGWKKATGLSISITAGQTYWIVTQLDTTSPATNTNYQTQTGEKYDYKSASTLPEPWGSSSASGAYLVAFYAVYSSGAKTLTAGSGTYAINGSSVSPLCDRKVLAGVGTYSTTGSTSTLRCDRTISAIPGSYAITVSDASLITTRKLSAETANYSVTGSGTGLLCNRILSAEAGSHAITGQDASLVYIPVGTYVLTAVSGDYNINGSLSSLLKNSVLPTEAGSYLATGTLASLLKSSKIAADFGIYDLIGSDATLSYAPAFGGYLLSCASGSYILAWSDVTLSSKQYAEVIHLTSSLNRNPILTSSLGRNIDLTSSLETEEI